MATSMGDIRAALVENLQSMRDVTGKPQVNPYRAESPLLPSIQVTGFDTMSKTTFGSLRAGYSIPVLIQAFVAKASERSAQETLDRWIHPTDDQSVWQAIESDKTLGGIVDDLHVTACDGSIVFTLKDGTEVIGSTWHVQVDL